MDTNTASLVELANTVAKWADQQPAIERVYLFGSRVRGDHSDSSDVDVFIEFVQAPTNDGVLRWTEENRRNFSTLKSNLPGTLSLHDNKDDAAFPAIHRGAQNSVLTIRKVLCVVTPPLI